LREQLFQAFSEIPDIIGRQVRVPPYLGDAPMVVASLDTKRRLVLIKFRKSEARRGGFWATADFFKLIPLPETSPTSR